MKVKKMNKNEEFKLLRKQMRDEEAKLAIEKEKEKLKWEEEYRIESILKAIEKYPLILQDFKNSTDFLVDEFFYVNNYTYNATLDNIHFTKKVAELLQADGFEVILKDVDELRVTELLQAAGFELTDSSLLGTNQPSYKIVVFKLK